MSAQKKQRRLPSRKALKRGYKIQQAFEECFAAGVERFDREGRPCIDVPPGVIDFESVLGGTSDTSERKK